jgi:hypothetical protein
MISADPWRFQSGLSSAVHHHRVRSSAAPPSPGARRPSKIRGRNPARLMRGRQNSSNLRFAPPPRRTSSGPPAGFDRNRRLISSESAPAPVRSPIEFGHAVFLVASTHGLITQYEVLNRNPGDEHQAAASLQRHRDTLGSVSELYGTDRGFYSERNALCEPANTPDCRAALFRLGTRDVLNRCVIQHPLDLVVVGQLLIGIAGQFGAVLLQVERAERMAHEPQVT